ncbi:MAG: hypothetical protein PV358_17995 [Acidimicrobiales bacterium]|nr:hypothetical protein [Acidimicrobiales bacterium]
MSAHRHELRIRHGGVDVQRHAFNAHDPTYVDEACDGWFRAVLGES